MTLPRFLFAILLLVLLQGCIPASIDTADTLENTGPYTALVSPGVSIDTISSDWDVKGRFYFPSGSFAANSRPLVIMLPGFGVGYNAYEIYSRFLASHGYVVFGMDYVNTSTDGRVSKQDHKSLQTREALDYILNTSTFKTMVNSNKVAIMGHSLGGKIAFYAASQDTRIKTVIALDPSNAGGPPCSNLVGGQYCAAYPVAPNPTRGFTGRLNDVQASSLIFRSQPDVWNPGAEFNAWYFFYGSDGAGTNGAPSPSTYIDMGAFPHAQYAPVLNQFGDYSYGHVLVKRNALAWLQQEFDGTDNSTYFTGAKMTADISAGRIVSTDAR